MILKKQIPWNKGKKTGYIPKTAFKKGQIPWNKDKKLPPHTEEQNKRDSEYRKKHPNSGQFLKGQTPWNKNKKYLQICNEKHSQWKGDNAGCGAIHAWIARQRGKIDTCEHCGKTGLKGQKIHWANIDHKYRRVIEDYIHLCVKCHRKYDKQFKIKNK